MLFTKATLVAISLAMPALARPSLQARTDPFDCQSTLQNCLATEPALADTCNQQYADCTECSTQEDSCRVGADYSKGLECTVQAQLCFHDAYGSGTVNGAYSCEQADNTCRTAPLTNQSFCASQNAACVPCINQEDQCRTAPGANQSYCAAQAAACYDNAITFNGEVTGISA